uniref:Uncharacterized protein n=1 Tax=Heterosigma akashiwo TaxID=2829 RepID=A0A6V1NRS9_HETAK|mmetsp:Transcript_33751/g.61367  ORF Transcript_33751/g.61367 Transcript_33751/m.61367 type:complete len:294 (-) Transcript_33751:424-1305(-)
MAEGKSNSQQYQLDYALNIAALNENYDLVDEKLQQGANPNWRNDSKHQYLNSALHMAAYKGNARICKRLLEGGANPEIENKYHNKPLIFASYYGKDDTVKELLAGGAEVMGVCRKNGLTSLHKACMQGHTSTLQILLDAGAYPNALDRKLRSPEDMIGVEAEEPVPEGVRNRIITMLAAGGRRVFSGQHPQHELCHTVCAGAAGSAVCQGCAWYLEKGAPVFACAEGVREGRGAEPGCREFLLCPRCVHNELGINRAGNDSDKKGNWLVNFLACKMECFGPCKDDIDKDNNAY